MSHPNHNLKHSRVLDIQWPQGIFFFWKVKIKIFLKKLFLIFWSFFSNGAAVGASFGDAEPNQITLNEDAPSTTIQIVLYDRRRIRVKFNLSHRVIDIYQHVMSYVSVRFWFSKYVFALILHIIFIFVCGFYATKRGYIWILFSVSGKQKFDLLNGFPPKPLKDPSLTIKDGGLKGASLSQKVWIKFYFYFVVVYIYNFLFILWDSPLICCGGLFWGSGSSTATSSSTTTSASSCCSTTSFPGGSSSAWGGGVFEVGSDSSWTINHFF